MAVSGRVLFSLAVTASETYNTASEDELRSRLAVSFAERTRGQVRPIQGGTPQRARPPDLELRAVREIVGIDPRLLARFASRRAAV